MDLGIRDKVALVTGASSGIGRACALALAAEGAKLAVAARRLPELEALVADARAAGATEARAFALDVSDGSSIASVCASVKAALGEVDILVCNGGGPKAGTFTAVSAGDWDDAYRLTLQSVLRLVDCTLPAMRERRWGRIIALESTSVKQPIPNLVLSNAFRTAVVGALKTLSFEVAAEGVTVNVIATGRIDTDRLRSIYDGDVERAAAGIPMGRVASPQEYAPLIAFLAGEPARYITGTTIAVDGGLSASLL